VRWKLFQAHRKWWCGRCGYVGRCKYIELQKYLPATDPLLMLLIILLIILGFGVESPQLYLKTILIQTVNLQA